MHNRIEVSAEPASPTQVLETLEAALRNGSVAADICSNFSAGVTYAAMLEDGEKPLDPVAYVTEQYRHQQEGNSSMGDQIISVGVVGFLLGVMAREQPVPAPHQREAES